MYKRQAAESALTALSNLSLCLCSKLTNAKSEIEELQSELHAAKEGEERAYEALKRLRTRTHNCARSSSRSRSDPADRIALLNSNESQIGLQGEITTCTTRHGSFSLLPTSNNAESALLKELHDAQERLAAGAKREEDLRTALSKAHVKLSGDHWATVGKDCINQALKGQLDDLQQKLVIREGKIAELSQLLEREKLMSTRHRDAAATVCQCFLWKTQDRVHPT